MSRLKPDAWQAVSPYLDEALAVPEEERASWIESLRGRNPEMAADVARLLAKHRKLSEEGFLEHPLDGADPAGIRCGSYRLLGLIGRGGMGSVYLAERADGEVTQRVAVKLLPASAGAIHRERFLQERQILARLAHANIARMLDAGHTEDGQPFLVMEYVEGTPIDTYAAGLNRRQRIALFLKVCRAVSYLHRNLVVHRDLKPSNILVASDGEPKLLDFGIAKILDLATDPARTAIRMLTPDYASPEQAAGASINTASDIYSLGAVLYELITGKHAHQFEDPTPEAVAAVIKDGEITRPGKWVTDLSPDLESILLKALRKDPQERYGTVEQFAEDLEAYLESRPVAARSGNMWYRTRKFGRRHWPALAAAALVIASLTTGLVVANRARRLAELRFSQLRILSSRVLELDRRLGPFPGTINARRELVDATLQYLKGLSETARGDLELSREVARGYYRVADIQGAPAEMNLGEPKKAEATFALAEHWITQVLDARPTDPSALSLGAMIAADRMFVAESEKRNEDRDRFLALADSRVGRWSRSQERKEKPEFYAAANMLYNMALQKVNSHRYEEAEQLLERAEAAAKLIGYEYIVVMSKSLRASAQQFRGNLDAALQLIESIPAQAPDGFPSGNAFYSVYTHQAQILGEDRAVSLGRTAEAIAVWERVFSELQKRARQDPKEAQVRDRSASVARQLGVVLCGGNPARALEVYDAALRGLAELPAVSTRRIERRAELLSGSANALRKLGQSAEASRRVRDAVRLLEQAKILPAETVALDSAAFAVMEAQAVEAQAGGDRERAHSLYADLLRRVEAAKPDVLHDLRDVPRMAALYEALGLEDRRLELWRHWSQRLPGNPFVEKQFALAQAGQKKVL